MIIVSKHLTSAARSRAIDKYVIIIVISREGGGKEGIRGKEMFKDNNRTNTTKIHSAKTKKCSGGISKENCSQCWNNSILLKYNTFS